MLTSHILFYRVLRALVLGPGPSPECAMSVAPAVMLPQLGRRPAGRGACLAAGAAVAATRDDLAADRLADVALLGVDLGLEVLGHAGRVGVPLQIL